MASDGNARWPGTVTPRQTPATEVEGHSSEDCLKCKNMQSAQMLSQEEPATARPCPGINAEVKIFKNCNMEGTS